MVYYEGLFFDKDVEEKILLLEKNKLEVKIDLLHCTFKYLPKNYEIFNDIVGKYYDIEITGYGYDENNSGFCLKLPEELEKYYINIEEDLVLPHITCSRSIDGESENTKNLVFSYFEDSIKVRARFGYCIKDENGNLFVSFDKFN